MLEHRVRIELTIADLQSTAFPLGYLCVAGTVGFEPTRDRFPKAVGDLATLRPDEKRSARMCELARDLGIEPSHRGVKAHSRPFWLIPNTWCRRRGSNPDGYSLKGCCAATRAPSARWGYTAMKYIGGR